MGCADVYDRLRAENEQLKEKLREREERGSLTAAVGLQDTTKKGQELREEAQRYIVKSKKREQRRAESQRGGGKSRDSAVDWNEGEEEREERETESGVQSDGAPVIDLCDVESSQEMGGSVKAARASAFLALQESPRRSEGGERKRRRVRGRESDRENEREAKRKRGKSGARHSDSLQTSAQGKSVPPAKKSKRATPHEESGTLDIVREDLADVVRSTPKATVARQSSAQRRRRKEELQRRAAKNTYNEVVRDKEKRTNMTGHNCHMCQKFYDALECGEAEKAKLLQMCSRHRHHHTPPSTPDGYW
eukprot:CAMPEP_0114612438 /NCGR_PEP_ID=MMETSP0168-20121206/4623_1 /TAXON_ID=95228 ORGANISM="Vannella sp., Strain DIVA3 517/6/12" /NCGR_SAMPLE_ID=MMETSP0168 /ASSEMBLY_ACC=CAM_ASM_000044 /LENGTH=305 /DNA_ID=CAMNT_0001823425 /DNA_START=62 /DNA_END=976 /DNA_ORIENTATION=-